MNLLSKETLIGAAALGAGAVGAKVVQAKVLPMVGVSNPNIQNGITLAGGILIPTLLKSSFGKGFGAGMIAASVAGLVQPFLTAQGITGDVFMGDVLMGNTNDVAPSSTLMGAYGTPSNDTTGGNSGEMDF